MTKLTSKQLALLVKISKARLTKEELTEVKGFINNLTQKRESTK